MKYTDKLYEKFAEESVYLFNVKSNVKKACTICIADKYGVYYDSNEFKNTYDEFLTLAHEYGHCITGATHMVYSPYQLIEQHEYRANRASIHEFLPYEMLEDAFAHDCKEMWQIAEYLDMPEKFVSLAIDVYRREGLMD